MSEPASLGRPAGSLVCVIDDDAEIRESLRSLLRSAGYQVLSYEAPEAFLADGMPEVPCCLVLDIRLGGASGLDFQNELKGARLAIPVVLMTGHGDIPMTVQGMKAGAIDFLPKPFTDEAMLAAVEAAICHDRTRRAAAAEIADLTAAYGRLTPREREVLGFVTSGLMNKQIAYEMGLSEITVKIHRGNMMRKMGARSLAQLVKMAEALQLREPEAQ